MVLVESFSGCRDDDGGVRIANAAEDKVCFGLVLKDGEYVNLVVDLTLKPPSQAVVSKCPF